MQERAEQMDLDVDRRGLLRRGGVIVAVGENVGDAARTIDAEGAIVAPGFVDIHSHYDARHR
jgi:N-acyl-D-aspartate/D-glutamate deacylase